MGTPWPERLSSNKKRVIQELVHGQECATQLQILFHKPSEEGGRLSAEELVHKILRSFDETLSVLSACDSAEVSHSQATSNGDPPCCDDRRSEDSSESRKRPVSKDRRGCYKRKRAAQTWTVVSATIGDGHAWRKYGQKEILNSKQPRSYFRCTRKYDQGCRATKQVQRMEDDSQMYQISYIGTHTCRDSFRLPQIISDSESWEFYMGSKISRKPQHHHLNPSTTATIKQESKEETTPHHLNPSTTPIIKQESKEETTPSDLTDLDSVMWKDIMGGGFEYSSEPAGMGSDYGDVVSNVYSCTEITSQNFELDFLIKPAEFENDFHFDEIEFV
ncbi:probable WRKY transcription factor 70 [Durio zibethinus]|uniref:Probable WRKY transcription factor 70 n=1 Tax=Durio zibethinus TaxID=66656 RepID=A0A6P6AHS6_DURZI|nr:probable WRKY transcription factor 70 [Durio zibethinus]